MSKLYCLVTLSALKVAVSVTSRLVGVVTLALTVGMAGGAMTVSASVPVALPASWKVVRPETSSPPTVMVPSSVPSSVLTVMTLSKPAALSARA